jgi:hypothetical protein
MTKKGTDGVRLIHVTFFRDEYARTKSAKDMALWDLRDLILTTSADAKTDLQLLKLAWFGDTPSEKNCLRYDANVRALSGVIGEHDAGTMSFDEALERLRAAKITALVYTSPSHTEARPRWRVIAPTSDSWSPAQHSCLIARLNGVLGGVLAPESFTLSQPYYFGKLNGNSAYCAKYTTGDFINLRFDLDAGAIYKKSKSKIDNLQLTDVTGIKPDVPIESLDDDRLKALPDAARYMIEHAKSPSEASEKIRALKGGRGHCYVVGNLVRLGLNNAQIKAIYQLGKIAHGPSKHGRRFDGYVERVIALCRSTEQEQARSLIAKLNEKHALVIVGGKAAILQEQLDDRGRQGFRLLSIDAFKVWYQNQSVRVGKKIVKAANYWLSHPERRSYSSIVFAPNIEVEGSKRMDR